MAAAEKFEHVSNPVARDTRMMREESGWSALPSRQNILRGMADAGQVVPPAVQEEFLHTGRFNKEWLREEAARFTRTELAEGRKLNDRILAVARSLKDTALDLIIEKRVKVGRPPKANWIEVETYWPKALAACKGKVGAALTKTSELFGVSARQIRRRGKKGWPGLS